MGLNETLDRLAKERERRGSVTPAPVETAASEVVLDRDEYDLVVSAARMLLNSPALKKDRADTSRKTKRKSYLRSKMQSALLKLSKAMK